MSWHYGLEAGNFGLEAVNIFTEALDDALRRTGNRIRGYHLGKFTGPDPVNALFQFLDVDLLFLDAGLVRHVLGFQPGHAIFETLHALGDKVDSPMAEGFGPGGVSEESELDAGLSVKYA